MTETWRQIAECPEYSVSNLGQVRRDVAGRRLSAGSIVAQAENHGGYMTVALYPFKRNINRRVHRLVCEAFHGPAPTPHHQAAHLDGNPKNNHAENLAWVTKEENEAHKVAHGTRAFGARHGNAKLTAADVRAIRASYETQAVIAARYGLSQSYVSQIRRKVWWADA